ncbi:MAG TPA: hypothetical protein VFE57_02560, partial [Cyclobacteriaceae bacterium]|nr:hypothetical protein [Cyclobacteriaceae bacterium]
KECKICGIVSGAEHKLTKTGRPFGRITLEDYSGNHTFTLFGDDYMKFKSYMMPGLFLFLEGTAARNTWGEQNLEFKIRNMELLNELANKRVQGLAIRVDVQGITFEFVELLDKLCKKNSGNSSFRLYLKDSSESIQVETLARLTRIKPSNHLIKELRRMVDDVGVITDRSEVRWLTAQVAKEPLAQKAEVGTISSTFVLESLES